MNYYKKVLVALSLEEMSDKYLISKINDFIADGSEVWVVHAVESVSAYGLAYGVGADLNIDEVLLSEATKALSKLLKPFHIPVDHQIVKMGVPKFVIVDEIDKHNIDLVVTGSHGRHGVRLLLGSTANGVLHSARCDVLAVRVSSL